MTLIVTCEEGIYDCGYNFTAETCAYYDGDYFNPEQKLVYPLLTGLFMCLSAFGLGANDAANSWATSVSSGAIRLFPATIVAGICEFTGAVSLGYGVSGKLQSGVSNLDDAHCWACGYCDSQVALYQVAMLSAQISTGIFLLLATFSSMPVSATHSIIGAIVGTTILTVGGSCLKWGMSDGLGGIVASWVISPVLASIVGVLIYCATRKGIVEFPAKWGGPRKAALNSFPVFIFVILFYMTFLILMKSLPTKDWKLGRQLLVSFCIAVAGSIAAFIIRTKVIYPRLPTHAKEKGHRDSMTDHAAMLVKRHSKSLLSLQALTENTSGEESDNNNKRMYPVASSSLGTLDDDGYSIDLAELQSADDQSVISNGKKAKALDIEMPNGGNKKNRTSSLQGIFNGVARTPPDVEQDTPKNSTIQNIDPSAHRRQTSLPSERTTTTDESLPGHETQGKSYAAGSTGHSTTRTRYRTLTAVFGPDDEQEEEMNRYGDKMKDSVEAELTEQAMIDAGIEPEDVSDLKDGNRKDAIYVFRYLLVFNAALESFAHGANDTANSTTAFSASMQLHKYGLYDCSAPTTDWWIMVIGGGFVALGVYVLGWKVIRTVGEKLTSVNYHRGFCIEFASTVTVVIATILEIPVSTTHCQVGAVVGVGLVAFGRDRVDFNLVGLIFLSWIFTLPFSGLVASGIMELIKVCI